MTGRITGMAMATVPRGLGPIAGRFARQQLGKYILKVLYIKMQKNRKYDYWIFNSEAVPHYQHVVNEMNIQQVMDGCQQLWI